MAVGRRHQNGCALEQLGAPVAEGDASGLTKAALDAALAGFIGWTDQVPPSTSAKKVEGEPAYARVHRGEAVTLPPSRVYLHRARWLKHDASSAQPGLNHLRSSSDQEPYLGRYFVWRTAGTSGRPAILVGDITEVGAAHESYAIARRWAGLAEPGRPVAVTSSAPWHRMSGGVFANCRSTGRMLRIDAARPMAEVVARLNEHQPDELSTYPSTARLLSMEKRDGRLRIAPRAILCSGEVLAPGTAALIERAFGVAAVDAYCAAETACLASQCSARRLHVHQDHAMLEVVDEHNRPVPAGTRGAKVLVTALFAHTVPLIRYEIGDQVIVSPYGCGCGLRSPVIEEVRGRSEDAAVLGGSKSEAPVPAEVFARVLDPLPAREWQVLHEPKRLRVLLSGAGSWLDQRHWVFAQRCRGARRRDTASNPGGTGRRG